MLEFLLALPVLLAIFVGAAALFRGAFLKTRCAVLTFEVAHRELVTGSSPGSSVTPLASIARGAVGIGRARGMMGGIQIVPSKDGVTATARCGAALETVRLPFLERARW